MAERATEPTTLGPGAGLFILPGPDLADGVLYLLAVEARAEARDMGWRR